jgi:D-methionine transport system ATP-binding protein
MLSPVIAEIPNWLKSDGPAAAVRPVVLFDQVSKTFRTPSGALAALKSVSLSINRGDIFGVIGRSGAGKSTLIRIVNGLEEPTSGKVFVNGIDMRSLSNRELERERRRIGMIFQHFNLLSAKTVGENVAIPLRIARSPKSKIRVRIDELLDLVGLTAKRDVYPAKLSGGERQRAGIARALANHPSILLSDEATSALDPETTDSILALLKRINRELGLTIILITHEMEVISKICDQVAVLDHGQFVEQGPVWKVFGRPTHETTHALLRTANRDLPDDLFQQLQPEQPVAGSSDAIIELNVFESGQGGVDISPLEQFFGDSVKLLYGGVDRIQGRSLGRLIVSVPADRINDGLNRFDPSVVDFRILGYVRRAS